MKTPVLQHDNSFQYDTESDIPMMPTLKQPPTLKVTPEFSKKAVVA